MQKYAISHSPLSDRYIMNSGGRCFCMELNTGLAEVLYNRKDGQATYFTISGGGKIGGMGTGYGPWTVGSSGGTTRSMDVGEMEEFYREMSKSLKHFSTQILGIGIPKSVTGMPTRRQVRRDLKEIYENARMKAFSKQKPG
jgi:hypothetical protein